MDINKVWLSGVVVSQPVLTRLSGKTPSAVFNLQVNEQFKDRQGSLILKPNIFRVESLGRAAEQTQDKVTQGVRYFVDGYLRHDNRDGVDEVRVRTFAVYEDRSDAAANHFQGIKRALDVIKKSRTKEDAIEKLEGMLTST